MPTEQRTHENCKHMYMENGSMCCDHNWSCHDLSKWEPIIKNPSPYLIYTEEKNND